MCCIVLCRVALCFTMRLFHVVPCFVCHAVFCGEVIFRVLLSRAGKVALSSPVIEEAPHICRKKGNFNQYSNGLCGNLRY